MRRECLPNMSSILTYASNQAEAGRKVIALQLDTGNAAAFNPLVQRVRELLTERGRKRFNYLVGNAGTLHYNVFEKTTEEELDSLYSVHFKSVFFLTQKLLSLTKDGGRIVMISSGLAHFSIPGSAYFASMKGAIEILGCYLPDDIGPMIASLLSEDNRWINT